MPKNRKTIVRDGHPVNLPAKTLERSTRLIDAAILFIYGTPETGERITTIKELGQICGIDQRTVATVMNDDRWEEHRLDLYALKRQEHEHGELGMFSKKRTASEIKRIEDERQRQLDEIPQLKLEADLILKRITLSDPLDKTYPALLNSLKKIEDMLEKRSGKLDMDTEEAELRGGVMKLAIEKAKRGESLNPPKGGEDKNMTIDI